MKFYAITIEPMSGIGTPIKGDTILGHFCWEVALDPSLVEGGLSHQLKKYDERPFVIFSTAFPKLKSEGGELVCALKKPAIPPPEERYADNELRIEKLRIRKEEKKRNWVIYRYGSDPMRPCEMGTLDNEGLYERSKKSNVEMRPSDLLSSKRFALEVIQSHNTINRIIGTTGEPPFAPYNCHLTYYAPGVELVLFVLLEESETDIDRVLLGLKRIGAFGFGRDSSTGMGRLEVKESNELDLPDFSAANARYTLAPCVPRQGEFQTCFFTPFVRFGRHGGSLARSANPFKNPVVMADEGAVFIPSEFNDKPFMGRAVRNVSKAESDTITQGYAPCLPLVTGS